MRFGHGLGLPHTNKLGDDDKLVYPYDPHSQQNPAYNQSRQYYVTYHDLHSHLKQAMPTMLSSFVPFRAVLMMHFCLILMSTTKKFTNF